MNCESPTVTTDVNGGVSFEDDEGNTFLNVVEQGLLRVGSIYVTFLRAWASTRPTTPAPMMRIGFFDIGFGDTRS